MKTLKNKVLVYDDNCPMCRLYSNWFVRWHLLPENGRLGYSQLPPQLVDQIDHDRYKREIALADWTGAPTIYGVDGLFLIFENALPFTRPILHNRIVSGFFHWLYPYISYNRSIIAPYRRIVCERNCAPPFSRKHRVAFLVIGVLISLLFTILTGLSIPKSLFPIATKVSIPVVLVLTSAVGWSLQILFASILLKDTPVIHDRITYLGHLVTLMIIGSGLLIPITAVQFAFHSFWPWVFAINALLSFLVMAKQHYDRVQIQGISQWWTAAWAFNLIIGAVVTQMMLV